MARASMVLLVVALVATCELARALTIEFSPAPGGEEAYISPCWIQVTEIPFCGYEILGPFINPRIELSIQPACCRVVRALKSKECWPLLFTPIGVSSDYAAKVAQVCGSH